MIAVSACLAGKKTRYDGEARKDERIARLVEEKQAIAICPECTAGLAIPRPPSEIVGGDGRDVLCGRARVVSKDGKDLTRVFVDAAYRVLETCQKNGVKKAVLKSKSPSCGRNSIYDGTFSGRLRKGPGVLAALLMQNGIEVEEV